MRRRHSNSRSEPRAVPPIRKLTEMREQARLSRYALANLSYTDDRYLARLEDGTALNPSREILLTLAMALVNYTSLFGRSDVDAVLKAGGYPPSPERLWRPSHCGGGAYGRQDSHNGRFRR